MKSWEEIRRKRWAEDYVNDHAQAWHEALGITALAKQVEREQTDEDRRWAEQADFDMFRWCTIRNAFNTLWAWIVNRP